MHAVSIMSTLINIAIDIATLSTVEKFGWSSEQPSVRKISRGTCPGLLEGNGNMYTGVPTQRLIRPTQIALAGAKSTPDPENALYLYLACMGAICW